jgi:hypothetical protein
LNTDAANFFMDLTRDTTPPKRSGTKGTSEVIDLTRDTTPPKQGRQSTAVARIPQALKRTARRPPEDTPGPKRINRDAAAAAYFDLTNPFPEEGTRQSNPVDLTATEVKDLTIAAVATEGSPTAFTAAIISEIKRNREFERLQVTPGWDGYRLDYANPYTTPPQGRQTRSKGKIGNGLPFGKNSRALNIALIRGEMAAGNTNPMLKKGLKKLLAGRGARIPSNTSQRIRFV